MENYIKNRLTRQIDENSDFVSLSAHPALTIEVIKAFPDKDWDWESVVYHKNFNVRWLKSFPDAPWEWYRMYTAKNFRMFWVQVFHEKNWDMRAISRRATINDLLRFPTLDWNWEEVTCVSNVTIQQMMMYPDLPWDFQNLAFIDISFPEIAFIRRFRDRFIHENWVDFTIHTSWDIIRMNFDLPWVYYWIKFETPEFIEDDLKLIKNKNEWNWEYLSINVHADIIMKNLHLPWVGDIVSQNRTLKYHHLSAPLEWDYSFAPCEPVPDVIRKWHSANVIKRAWRSAIANPEYTMCRNRITREAEELIELK
jgi:hypothetical protein